MRGGNRVRINRGGRGGLRMGVTNPARRGEGRKLHPELFDMAEKDSQMNEGEDGDGPPVLRARTSKGRAWRSLLSGYIPKPGIWGVWVGGDYNLFRSIRAGGDYLFMDDTGGAGLCVRERGRDVNSIKTR